MAAWDPFPPLSWRPWPRSLAASPSGPGCGWESQSDGWSALFAWVLTRVDADFAGRAFAAYGSIYIPSV
ncbi:hypothetical protein MTBLM5_40006 [Magnetospirillum sp. LM-5]|nr:hypothetical protein MTBLM5_40006 [Magnetospirillum sp. LM-5]